MIFFFGISCLHSFHISHFFSSSSSSALFLSFSYVFLVCKVVAAAGTWDEFLIKFFILMAWRKEVKISLAFHIFVPFIRLMNARKAKMVCIYVLPFTCHHTHELSFCNANSVVVVDFFLHFFFLFCRSIRDIHKRSARTHEIIQFPEEFIIFCYFCCNFCSLRLPFLVVINEKDKKLKHARRQYNTLCVLCMSTFSLNYNEHDAWTVFFFIRTNKQKITLLNKPRIFLKICNKRDAIFLQLNFNSYFLFQFIILFLIFPCGRWHYHTTFTYQTAFQRLHFVSPKTKSKSKSKREIKLWQFYFNFAFSVQLQKFTTTFKIQIV